MDRCNIGGGPELGHPIHRVAVCLWLQVGQLVDVVGRIGEALPADGKGGRRRVIEAEKVCLALDPDMESLRLIEPTSLYRHYCTRKQLPNVGGRL